MGFLCRSLVLLTAAFAMTIIVWSCAPAVQWQQFASNAYGFSADMPATVAETHPSEQEVSFKSRAGDRQFWIMISPHAPSLQGDDHEWREFESGLFSGPASIKFERAFQGNSASAREYSLNEPNGWLRVWKTPKYFYALLAAKCSEQEATHFFESFRLQP